MWPSLYLPRPNPDQKNILPCPSRSIGRDSQVTVNSPAMPTLSALDLLEARGLPRRVSLLSEIDEEMLNRFEENANDLEWPDAVAVKDAADHSALCPEHRPGDHYSRVSTHLGQRSLSSNIDAELLDRIKECRAGRSTHCHTWCSSMVKHRARGLPTGQETAPQAWANEAIYTNSFSRPNTYPRTNPFQHRHTQTFPSYKRRSRRRSWSAMSRVECFEYSPAPSHLRSISGLG